MTTTLEIITGNADPYIFDITINAPARQRSRDNTILPTLQVQGDRRTGELTVWLRETNQRTLHVVETHVKLDAEAARAFVNTLKEIAL